MLPGALTAPPIMTSFLSFRPKSGSINNARATFVRGPVATRINSDWYLFAISTRKAGAGWASGCPVGSGTSALPSPFGPWKKVAVERRRTRGWVAPLATGTSFLPAISRTARVFRVVWSTVTFPATLVQPSNSTSGERAASRIARASSAPVSTSRIIFSRSVMTSFRKTKTVSQRVYYIRQTAALLGKLLAIARS